MTSSARLVAASMVLVAAAGLPGCSDQKSTTSGSVPGGKAAAPVSSREVAAAAAFAVEAQAQALRQAGGGQPVSLDLVRILAAEQQVVAGMNYYLTLRVKHNGQEKTADAVVWWQSWREPDPYQLTSWTWR